MTRLGSRAWTGDRRRERARLWSLPLPALPAIQRGGHTFVQRFLGRFCSLCQHPERTTRGKCRGARSRGAALQFRLDGSADNRIVDLVQGGNVVSVLCVVCGSYCGRVVRRSLLSNCLGALTPARLRALRDVLLGFLHGSKRTARLTVFLEKFCVPSLIHVAPGAHFLRFCPAPFCRSNAA